MIVLRTKQFIAPLLAAVGGPIGLGIMGGGAAISAVQGHNQTKEMEKQGEEQRAAAEKQAELIKQQNKTLQKIAQRSKTNPNVAGETANYLMNRNFAIPVGLTKAGSDLLKRFKNSNSGKFIRSVGSASKEAFEKNAIDNVKIGAAVAGTTYLGGKYIQHNMNKNNLDIKDGQLISKSYSIPGKALNLVKRNKGTLLMGGMMGGAPLVLQYAADKKQVSDQISNTQRPPMQLNQSPIQKQYAIPTKGLLKGVGSSFSGMKKSASEGMKTFRSHPMQSLTGFASNMASFGIGGTKNIQAFGKNMIAHGKKNNSDLAIKAGKWIGNHKTAANALSIVPGAVAAKVTWDGTTKVGDKIGNTIDPNAYKYKNMKDQQVQQ